MKEEQVRALQLATEAGHILLENGAEISRVEETMETVASAFGVEEESFFVLSNGIITSGPQYARAEFIPMKGTQLSKVVEVNQLSRDVSAGRCDLDGLQNRLSAIRAAKGKPWWELTIGIALGVCSFCILFGGSLMDAAATFCCGLLLGLYIAFVVPHVSRITGNVTGGFVGGILCIFACYLSQSVGHLHLANMIIGTIIALVPGVSFTNGIRDLANEDYIAGTTRLTDAFITFLCIALGVALSLLVHGFFAGGIVDLGAPVVDPVAAKWGIQLLAAFIGTIGFSIMFGAPRRAYIDCGLAGLAGWLVFLGFSGRWVSAGVVLAAFAGGLAVALMSHIQARYRKCPSVVFLVCGIIPLVPGGGIFWTAYHLVSDHLAVAATTGFMALKVTIAIAASIILASELFDRVLKKLLYNA